jgi:phosphatidylglycerophosphate synthase
VKPTGFFADYTRALKNPLAEEIIDLILFRPLGYLCVKMFLPFPITPNQVSCLAMAFGIAAGIFLSHGTPASVMTGGILYGLSNILDCSDGMLARIKKNGSPTGRIVDGVVDYITGAAVYIGLGIGLSKAVNGGILHLPFNAWLLVVVAAASTGIHAVLSDKYRNAYLDRKRPASDRPVNDLEKFSSELVRLRGMKGKLIDKSMISLYLGYLRLQEGRASKSRPTNPVHVTPAKVIVWNLIGPSTHIVFFLAAAVFFKPMILFTAVAGCANIWMIALLVSGPLFSPRLPSP